MSVIFLNAAHTPRSPGGVYGGLTEHGEGMRLCRAIEKSLLQGDEGLDVRIFRGEEDMKNMHGDDVLVVLHKGHNEKNEHKHGADIYVKADADCDTQYEAHRLLNCLNEGGIAYRRVHTLTAKSPYRVFGESSPRKAFLIETGFLDSSRDRLAWERMLALIAARLAGEIVKIYKEEEYEDIA